MRRVDLRVVHIPIHVQHVRSTVALLSLLLGLDVPWYPSQPDLGTSAPYLFALRVSRPEGYLWNWVQEVDKEMPVAGRGLWGPCI